MGRANYRSGKAPLKTASELASLLPIPLLLITEGYAHPSFPGSDPAGPALFVSVIASRYDPRMGQLGLPLRIHWKQWQEICVPVLENLSTYRWRGKIKTLGDVLALLQDIVGPTGVVIFDEGDEVGDSLLSTDSVGRLYACDPPGARNTPSGKTATYLALLSSVIFDTADEAGY